jgi:hypothetical protein
VESKFVDEGEQEASGDGGRTRGGRDADGEAFGGHVGPPGGGRAGPPPYLLLPFLPSILLYSFLPSPSLLLPPLHPLHPPLESLKRIKSNSTEVGGHLLGEGRIEGEGEEEAIGAAPIDDGLGLEELALPVEGRGGGRREGGVGTEGGGDEGDGAAVGEDVFGYFGPGAGWRGVRGEAGERRGTRKEGGRRKERKEGEGGRRGKKRRRMRRRRRRRQGRWCSRWRGRFWLLWARLRLVGENGKEGGGRSVWRREVEGRREEGRR